MTKDEALKLALEYVELVPDDRYNAEHIDREALVTAIREALAQPEHGWTPERIAGMARLKDAQDKKLAQPEQEPVAWRDAAIRLGEELSSVGPDGYYNMSARQWLDWSMEQKPRGKNSLPPQRKPLTENEIKHLWYEACQTSLELTSQLIVHLARNIEAAHGIKGEA